MGRRADKRTVSFFRLVAEKAGGDHEALKDVDWQAFLENVRKLSLEERTYAGPTRRLIGTVMTVDGDFALKLMEPRDENSWLELLRQEKERTGDQAADADAPLEVDDLDDGDGDGDGDGGADGGQPAATELESEAVDPARFGQLVETTVIAFLDRGNLVGMIRGSTASPTHTALAEWLDHITVDGESLAPPKCSVVAEPALSKGQKKKLKNADGVSSTTLRIAGSKAGVLKQAGLKQLYRSVQSLSEQHGNLFVTIKLSIPRGKAHVDARRELQETTRKLQKVVGHAESLSATLVHYDAEERQHAEDVNFVAQRITAKTEVPLVDDAGEPIRNASAVRAILRAAEQLDDELADD